MVWCSCLKSPLLWKRASCRNSMHEQACTGDSVIALRGLAGGHSPCPTLLACLHPPTAFQPSVQISDKLSGSRSPGHSTSTGRKQGEGAVLQSGIMQ